MFGEASGFVDVLPDEQQAVLLEHGVDVGGGEVLADRGAVFVVDDATRLVKDHPASLPRHVADVGVFEVERLEQSVETAQLEEFAAVVGCGSAAGVEGGEEGVHLIIVAVCHVQTAVDPTTLHEAGLLAALVGVGEVDLRGDGEDAGVGESFEQGFEEAGLGAHVVVEQQDDVVGGAPDAGVRTTTEAEVLV